MFIGSDVIMTTVAGELGDLAVCHAGRVQRPVGTP